MHLPQSFFRRCVVECGTWISLVKAVLLTMPSQPLTGFFRRVLKRLLLLLLMLTFVTGYGMVGFYFIEESSLFDSLYMSVITLTTVGFREAVPLSDAGRMFAISLIYLGVTGSGLSVAMLSNLLFKETLLDVLKGTRMERKIRQLDGHYIVCGFGTTGRSIVEELLGHDERVVIVDQRNLTDDVPAGCLFLRGDARQDETLQRLGIEKARGLASCLTEDADNVFVTLTARSLNPDLRIVSRYKHPDTARKLVFAGADDSVSPYRIGGHRLALALTDPAFLGVLDATFQRSSLEVRFTHIQVPSDSPIRDKTLAGADFRTHAHGALIIAIQNAEGKAVFNPDPTVTLEDVDQLLVLGDDAQIRALRAYVRGMELGA